MPLVSTLLNKAWEECASYNLICIAGLGVISFNVVLANVLVAACALPGRPLS